MDTFLRGDTANEGEQRHFVIKLAIVEVLLLQHSLCFDVVRRRIVQLLESFLDWNSIWEGERPAFLLKQRCERGSVEQFVSVRPTDSRPLV